MVRLGKLILHFNTPELTEELCRMVPGAIVIDNGSTEKPYKGKNRCIRQDNLGFTKGWNTAVKTLFDEFDAFWLMNSDIKPQAGCVKRVEELLNKRPDVSFFTPAYNCWMKHCQPAPSKSPPNGGDFKTALVETNVMEFTAPVIRKRVFEKIGFFDEVFVRGYGVEFDFCYRARMAGIQMHVDHGSRFYHLGQQTISKHGGVISYSKVANAELHNGLRAKYGPNYGNLLLYGLRIKTDLDMKVAIYTTIFGNYDTLKDIPEQEVKADLFLITDQGSKEHSAESIGQNWKVIVPDYPRKDLHPRMRAKFFKMFPWEVEELKKYDVTIYIDASIRITSGNFVATCLKNLTKDFLLFRHPNRNCIYEEGKASLIPELKKYRDEPIQEQLNFYRKFHPANAGLYACGVMIRKNTEIVRRIMADWWFENIKYSFQDQLSLPVVLRANKYTPATFVENQYKNSFLKVEWHDDREESAKCLKFGVPKVEGLKDGRNEGLKENNVAGCELRDAEKGKGEGEGTGEGSKEKREPFFTVLMPVWRTEYGLFKKALNSILNQSFRDFELLIVDDNNDNKELIDEMNYWATEADDAGPAVRVIRTLENKGLAATLNYGLSEARGRYIVRMDSDDVANRELLNKHFNHILVQKEMAICGVQLNLMKDGKLRNVSNLPAKVDRAVALAKNDFWLVNHPGVCYAREVALALGGYPDTPKHLAEDYPLWCKFLKAGFVIQNLPDALIDYRLGNGSQIGQDREGKEWKEWLEGWKKTLE